MNSHEVEQHYHHAVAEQRYSDALEIATRYFDVFPTYAQRVVYFWRMDMACRIDDGAQAIHVLREAVNAGHWYARLDENPTFAALKGIPEFEELCGRCAERRATAIATAPAIIKMLQPEQASMPAPLVYALHGNSENVETFASHWHTAPSQGWFVALPQSPEALGPDRFVWNDW